LEFPFLNFGCGRQALRCFARRFVPFTINWREKRKCVALFLKFCFRIAALFIKISLLQKNKKSRRFLNGVTKAGFWRRFERIWKRALNTFFSLSDLFSSKSIFYAASRFHL
jgi:hypothetical protein